MAKIYKSKSNKFSIISIVLIIVLAAIAIYFVCIAADGLERAQDEETIMATKNAVVKAAVQCYALEGQYPTGIDYLEENYGLTLNKDKYVYSYESIGANIMPTIKVYSLD